MPIGAYFKGHGSEVMQSMLKSNRGNTKAAEREFYATANARKMKPPASLMPKGASQSPRGDIGVLRQEESVKAGGFKAGSTVYSSKEL